jgi:hypothetical protein
LSPVTPTDLAPLGRLAKARLSLEILSAYARTRWTLRAGGRDAAAAVARLRDHARRHRIAEDRDTEVTAGWRLANATIKTLEPLPSDSRCLFRSLTLLTVMERRNLSPTLIIGVRPEPFAAHAWIELHGQALLPDGDGAYERIAEL